VFEINKYTVTFLADGQKYNEQIVEYSQAAQKPADPQKTGYTFKGWDKEFGNITSDLTVNAIFEINLYTVTFVDWNGAILSTQTVPYGSAAIAPANPIRKDWIFAGWDADFFKISGDLKVQALYKPTIIDVIPTAFVAKLSGNKNELTITVTELWSDGSNKRFTEKISIDNNAAGTYTVGGYKVFVDTKGNDQIRACNIVK